MKQNFTVTGMACDSQPMFHGPGALLSFQFPGGSEFPRETRALPVGQAACTRRLARALTPVAEQAMPEEVIP